MVLRSDDTSARALASAESGRVQGSVAAHSLTTLFYLLAKHHKSALQARVALTGLMAIPSAAQVDQAAIEQALNLPYQGFEDALQ